MLVAVCAGRGVAWRPAACPGVPGRTGTGTAGPQAAPTGVPRGGAAVPRSRIPRSNAAAAACPLRALAHTAGADVPQVVPCRFIILLAIPGTVGEC